MKSQKSTYLAMFPLNILMIPGEQMPLHIFEPRYRQLFDEMEKDDIPVALPYTPKDDLALAAVCKLVRVTKRFRSGERDVIIECTGLHHLKRVDKTFKGKLYPGGEAGEEVNAFAQTKASVALLEQFADYIEIKYGQRPKLGEIQHYRLMDVAACIALSNEDKLRFIKATDDEQRARHLGSMLKYLHFLYFQEEQSENGILLN